jgi:hypothetical protein
MILNSWVEGTESLLSTALRKILATLNAEGRGDKRKGAQSIGTGISL